MSETNFNPDLCAKLGVDPNDLSPLPRPVAGPPSPVTGSVTHTFPHAEPVTITAKVLELVERHYLFSSPLASAPAPFWLVRLLVVGGAEFPPREFYLPLEAMPRETTPGKHVLITVKPLW
jgi:hypothetical protein